MTLARLTDNKIVAICDVIRRPSGLVSGKTSGRGDQISIPVAQNLKLNVFVFKTMEPSSMPYDTYHIHRKSLLQYQHKWEFEQR